jgi:hypothetical protein
VDDRILCSIEFLDEDGDLVVTHALLNEADAKKLIIQFASFGITATINFLNGSIVSSGDGSNSPLEIV